MTTAEALDAYYTARRGLETSLGCRNYDRRAVSAAVVDLEDAIYAIARRAALALPVRGKA